jgi:hypothetical protein
MMETEMVSETLGFYPQLARLIAREDKIIWEESPLIMKEEKESNNDMSL